MAIFKLKLDGHINIKDVILDNGSVAPDAGILNECFALTCEAHQPNVEE